MTIKDKSGKVYKLRGPNPMMKDQNRWDLNKLELINMGWSNDIVVDERNPINKFKTDFNVVDITEKLNLVPNKEANAEIVKSQNFIEEIQEESVVEKIEEPAVSDTNHQLDDIFKEKGVEYYCAPVIGEKQHVDDLYDNTYSTMKYGDKFVFVAVIIKESDLELQFWCVCSITINSIVFKKIKIKGQRWWRIKEISPKTGGYLCRAITSDTNPDFS